MFKQTEHRDRCGLCGKKKDQVPKLVVGLHAAICSDCIKLSNDILTQEGSTNHPDPETLFASEPTSTALQSALSKLLIRIPCPQCQSHNLLESKYCCQCGVEINH